MSASVELSQKGYEIALWNRSEPALAPFRTAKGIQYEGVLGDGFTLPAALCTDISQVLQGAEVILVCLPTLALAGIAQLLGEQEINIPVVLNPGHTGGALEFYHIFKQQGRTPPPIAEFSTLSYVARKSAPNTINITGAANHLWVAKMPGGEKALSAAQELYPVAENIGDVLGTSLTNVNMVLHPPGAVLGASWAEHTGGDFTFYVEGLTDGVGRVLEQLDQERIAVGAAFGHQLPDLFAEMRMIGTIEKETPKSEGLTRAIRSGKANKRIKAPDTLEHRYYQEDLWFGLRPFLAFASLAKVEVPIARSLMHLGQGLLGNFDENRGRTAQKMGIAGMTGPELMDYIKG